MAERQKSGFNPITGNAERRTSQQSNSQQLPRETGQTQKQRTSDFFNRPLMAVFDDLLDGEYVIGVQGTYKKAQVERAEPFPKAGTSWRGRMMSENMRPGDLWNAPWLGKPQSLILGRQAFSCIRLMEVYYYNSQSNEFVPELETPTEGKFTPAESEISRYLGLEIQDVSSLKFLDNSNTLYVVKDRNIGYRKKR